MNTTLFIRVGRPGLSFTVPMFWINSLIQKHVNILFLFHGKQQDMPYDIAWCLFRYLYPNTQHVNSMYIIISWNNSSVCILKYLQMRTHIKTFVESITIRTIVKRIVSKLCKWSTGYEASWRTHSMWYTNMIYNVTYNPSE